MSAQPSTAKNNTVTYLLGLIVLLLVAIVAIVVIRSQGSAAQNGQIVQTPPASTPSAPVAQEPPFDPAKATKVPASESPDKYVQRYYDDVTAKKWDEAYKMLPVGKQSFYGNVAAFQSSQASYGVKSVKLVSYTPKGNDATVEVEQDLGTNGVWIGTWTFVKANGTWLVKDRTTSPKQ